jgi:hypothetical protein
MKAKQPPKEQLKAADLRPDGWERFERAIDAAVKAGPKHKTAKKQSRRKSH